VKINERGAVSLWQSSSEKGMKMIEMKKNLKFQQVSDQECYYPGFVREWSKPVVDV
jgi:hypothetical protein